MNSTLTAGLDDLAARLDGGLARAGDPSWDAARQSWHLAVDQRPSAVVVARSVADVVATVCTARALGLRVAAQATGHNAGPMGPLDGTILLKTSAMRGVTIDPEARFARVEAGALWMDVTGLAAKHGLAALAGSAADVGVVGYTLGGGLSWLGRSHGLAANSVLAAEVVTADGRLHTVDAEHDPDLFWALRGGGGSFAVVTALTFRLFPIEEVHAGVLFFPLERAAEVLHAYREWVQDVPDSVTSVGRLLRFPPLPDLPDFLRGQSFAVVEAACQLPQDEADALLAPLRELGPAIDTFRPTPMPELALLHMDPDGPVPGFGDGLLISAATGEAIDAMLAAAGPETDAPLLSVELRHLGGALTPGRMTGGAVTGLDAQFAMFAVGIAPSEEAAAAVRESVDAVQCALAPWATGGAYVNFAERRKADTALFGASARRLREVKAAYDPADVIRGNHAVRPA
ncbi:MAG: hypothetical protein QOE97_2575 [Pseudonocardiales bacterium]|nr:hypothetical protein [Pseudonocardiales bacterium]